MIRKLLLGTLRWDQGESLLWEQENFKRHEINMAPIQKIKIRFQYQYFFSKIT